MKRLCAGALALLLIFSAPGQANAMCIDPLTGEPCFPEPSFCLSDLNIPWGAIIWTVQMICAPFIIPVEETEQEGDPIA